MSAPDVVTVGRADRHPRTPMLAGVVDALVVAAWFAVTGAIGAFVWSRVTTLPKLTKTGSSATLSPEELVKQVGIDGWFFVIALVGGLVGGIVLMAWRRRDPLLMVVLVVLGGAFASWLMVRLGLVLGPQKEVAALGGMADGAQVSMRLKLSAPGMGWMWPISAGLGAFVYLWILARPEQRGAIDS